MAWVTVTVGSPLTVGLCQVLCHLTPSPPPRSVLPQRDGGVWPGSHVLHSMLHVYREHSRPCRRGDSAPGYRWRPSSKMPLTVLLGRKTGGQILSAHGFLSSFRWAGVPVTKVLLTLRVPKEEALRPRGAPLLPPQPRECRVLLVGEKPPGFHSWLSGLYLLSRWWLVPICSHNRIQMWEGRSLTSSFTEAAKPPTPRRRGRAGWASRLPRSTDCLKARKGAPTSASPVGPSGPVKGGGGRWRQF